MAQVQMFSDIGYCSIVDRKSWLRPKALKLKKMDVKLSYPSWRALIVNLKTTTKSPIYLTS